MGRSFLSTFETWDKGRNKSRSVCFWCLWATLWAGERHLFSMIFAPSSCTRGCSRVGFNEKRLWTPLNGMEGWARSTNVNSRNRRSRVHFPPRATCEEGEHMETNAWQFGYTNGFEWRADSGGAFLVRTCFQILRIWDYQGFILLVGHLDCYIQDIFMSQMLNGELAVQDARHTRYPFLDVRTASSPFIHRETENFHVSDAERRARRSGCQTQDFPVSQTLNGELAVRHLRHGNILYIAV